MGTSNKQKRPGARDQLVIFLQKLTGESRIEQIPLEIHVTQRPSSLKRTQL